MKTLLHLLGGMLVDQGFREAMIADPEATLDAHNFGLSAHDKEIALHMVKSFDEDKLDDAIARVGAECPYWPCSDSSMAV